MVRTGAPGPAIEERKPPKTYRENKIIDFCRLAVEDDNKPPKLIVKVLPHWYTLICSWWYWRSYSYWWYIQLKMILLEFKIQCGLVSGDWISTNLLGFPTPCLFEQSVIINSASRASSNAWGELQGLKFPNSSDSMKMSLYMILTCPYMHNSITFRTSFRYFSQGFNSKILLFSPFSSRPSANFQQLWPPALSAAKLWPRASKRPATRVMPQRKM